MSADSLATAKTLFEMQKAGSPPAVRLGAARAFSELGVKLRESADLEERLALLEEHWERQKLGFRGRVG